MWRFQAYNVSETIKVSFSLKTKKIISILTIMNSLNSFDQSENTIELNKLSFLKVRRLLMY